MKDTILEFFTFAKILLYYEWNSEIQNLVFNILKAMMHIYHSRIKDSELKSIISSLSSIQTISDAREFVKVMDDMDKNEKFALSVKSNMILRHEIKTVSYFDMQILKDEISHMIERGDINGYKLSAYLDYTENKLKTRNCINIWETLALYGDIPSIKALQYVYKAEKNTSESEKWMKVEKMLDEGNTGICRTFDYEKITECESIAAIIYAVKERNRQSGHKAGENIDKYLVFYILNSKDKLPQKIKNILCTNNFYLKLNSIEEMKVGF